MTGRAAIVGAALVSLAAVPHASARPAPGVQKAVRRFPAFGVLMQRLPEAEVAIAECDLFGEASASCDEALARDLAPALRVLSLPARRRHAGDASVTCASGVIWHGVGRAAPSFTCDVVDDLSETHLAFACQPPEPDGTQYCDLRVRTSNDDEDRAYAWAYSITGAGATTALGPVVFSYAINN